MQALEAKELARARPAQRKSASHARHSHSSTLHATLANRSPRASALARALSLRDFVHRSAVLTSYRAFLRELRGLPRAAADDLRAQVRRGFAAPLEGGAHGAGQGAARAAAKARLAEADRQLHFLRVYAGTARAGAGARGGGPPAAAGAPGPAGGAGAPGGGDTWVGSGDGDDVRGRLGQQWPWDER